MYKKSSILKHGQCFRIVGKSEQLLCMVRRDRIVRLSALAWKAGIPQGIASSNLAPSAVCTIIV